MVPGGNLPPLGPLLVAEGRCFGTARAEDAPFGGRNRAGDFPLNEDPCLHPLFLDSGVGDGDRGEKPLRIGVEGSFVEVLSGSELHQVTKIHDSNACAEVLHHGQIVGDEEVGEPHLFLEGV